ncbi:MAG: AsmA family protein [Acidobacteriota bacterium]|nr:AsmA family protein [Acidobacteriota bacterium]
MMAPDETPTNSNPPRRRRWLRRLAIAVAVVATLLIVTILVGFWRLSHGPVELGFLEPRLDEALRGTGNAPSVQIRNPVVTWGGLRRPLDLRAGPVRVIDPESRAIVELEEVSLGLAVPELLRGRVSPTRIEVARLWVQLVRTEDGRVAVGFEARDATESPPGGTTDPKVTDLLKRLLDPPDPKNPLGLMQELRIVESQISWDDRVWDRTWLATEADIRLARNPDGLELSLDLDATAESKGSEIDLDASFTRSTGLIDATVELTEVEIPELTGGIPGLEGLKVFDDPVNASISGEVSTDGRIRAAELELDTSRGRVSASLQQVDDGMAATATITDLNPSELAGIAPDLGRIRLPLTIELSAELDPSYKPRSAELTLRAGTGELMIPEAFDDPVAVTGVVMKASATDDMTRFRLDEATFDLGDIAIAALGTADLENGVLSSRLSASIPKLEVSLIDRFWPLIAVPDVRKWITTNITTGEIREIEVQAELALPVAPAGSLRVDGLDGAFAYRDLEVAYLRPITPVTEVTGQGRFNLGGFDFDVADGTARDIALGPAHVTIAPLSGHTRLGIEADVNGPLRTALEIIDSKPLELLAEPLPQPEQFSGTAVSHLVLDVALSGSDPVPMSLSGTSRTTGAGVVGWPFGLDVTGSDLEVGFDMHYLEFDGVALANGVPIDIRWWESIAGGPLQREGRAIATLTEADRHALGILDVSQIGGAIGVDLRVKQPGGAPMKVDLAADLADTSFSVSQVKWSKPRGAPGSGIIEASIDDGWTVSVDRFDITAGDLHTTGNLSFEPELRGLRKLVLEKLEFGDFEATGVFSRDSEEISLRDFSARYGPSDIRGTLKADLTGAKPSVVADFRSDTVDLRPFLPSKEEKAETEDAPDIKEEKKFGDFVIPDEPITLPFFDRFEGTLQWTAANFHGPASHGADFEIGLDLRNGRLRVDPIAANGTQGGYLTGRIDLESVDQGFTVQSHLQLDGGHLDLAKSESDPSRWPTFDFDMELGSHGRSLRELANHAKGHIGFILGEGMVASTVLDYLGADILVELFEALNPFTTKQAETNLECAVARLNLAEGIVTLKPFAVRSERVTTVGGGSLDLKTEKLSFDWITKPRRGLGISASALTNPYIKVGGTLSKPTIAVKPLEATVQTGAAVATMGLSLVAQGLWNRMTSGREVCRKAIEEAGAGLNEE